MHAGGIALGSSSSTEGEPGNAAEEHPACFEKRLAGFGSPPPRGGDGGAEGGQEGMECEDEDETAASSLGPAHDEELPSLLEPAQETMSAPDTATLRCQVEAGEAGGSSLQPGRHGLEASQSSPHPTSELPSSAGGDNATSSDRTDVAEGAERPLESEQAVESAASDSAGNTAAAADGAVSVDTSLPPPSTAGAMFQPGAVPAAAATAAGVDQLPRPAMEGEAALPPPTAEATAVQNADLPAQPGCSAVTAAAAPAGDASRARADTATEPAAAVRILSEATLGEAVAASAGTVATTAERSAVRRVSDIEGALTSIKVRLSVSLMAVRTSSLRLGHRRGRNFWI